ncbi:hypothetical protein ACFWY6_23655, partial [Streptomyces sp. NPDC059037]
AQLLGGKARVRDGPRRGGPRRGGRAGGGGGGGWGAAPPHDAGYLPVTEIAGRVRVRGRGGTVLQPGIDLLQRAEDFPAAAPVLVITDGECDVLRVRREHAYLLPSGGRLPFTARGPVFRVR